MLHVSKKKHQKKNNPPTSHEKSYLQGTVCEYCKGEPKWNNKGPTRRDKGAPSSAIRSGQTYQAWLQQFWPTLRITGPCYRRVWMCFSQGSGISKPLNHQFWDPMILRAGRIRKNYLENTVTWTVGQISTMIHVPNSPKKMWMEDAWIYFPHEPMKVALTLSETNSSPQKKGGSLSQWTLKDPEIKVWTLFSLLNM